MASSVIGALRVNLGLDSAKFTKGLKRSQSSLAKFAKAAKLGLGVATAAAAALGVAVKGSIDHADKLSKTSQKIGITTEALSRLEYAAELSGSTLEGLASGIKKLSQNMDEIAQGRGAQASSSFEALGIAVKDAEGKLRSSDDVLSEVADKFSRMEDGTKKTALAMGIFGRSGVDLIPMLNQGRDGLKQMADESDRLGNTIDTKTGRAAEKFNDTMTRLQTALGGVVNKVMMAVLPSLDELMDTIASPEFAKSAQDIGVAIVRSMDMASKAIIKVVDTVRALKDGFAWLSTHDMFGNEVQKDPKIQAMRDNLRVRKELAAGLKKATGGLDSFDMGAFYGSGDKEVGEESSSPFTAIVTGAGEASAALDRLTQAGQSVFEATRSPAEALASELERLKMLLDEGAIDWDTYGRAVKVAQEQFDAADSSANKLGSDMQSALGSITGTLEGLIGGTKSWNDALADVLSNLAQIAIKQLTMNTGAGGGGNIFGSLLGGLFGLPAFASGTNCAPGGLSLVGEKGPELVNLPRGSQVIPNHKIGQRNGAQPATVNTYVTIQTPDVRSFKSSESQIAARLSRASQRGARNL